LTETAYPDPTNPFFADASFAASLPLSMTVAPASTKPRAKHYGPVEEQPAMIGSLAGGPEGDPASMLADQPSPMRLYSRESACNLRFRVGVSLILKPRMAVSA